MTIEDMAPITAALIARSRRRMAAQFKVLADAPINKSNRMALLAQVAIAEWEAMTLERDGKLPAEYLALLP